ncbi:MAG: flagellar hook-length control protein FliK [Treponema sp.]|nr:flagellar hook-length control protein FliK [Treponema sp.]
MTILHQYSGFPLSGILQVPSPPENSTFFENNFAEFLQAARVNTENMGMAETAPFFEPDPPVRYAEDTGDVEALVEAEEGEIRDGEDSGSDAPAALTTTALGAGVFVPVNGFAEDGGAPEGVSDPEHGNMDSREFPAEDSLSFQPGEQGPEGPAMAAAAAAAAPNQVSGQVLREAADEESVEPESALYATSETGFAGEFRGDAGERTGESAGELDEGPGGELAAKTAGEGAAEPAGKAAGKDAGKTAGEAVRAGERSGGAGTGDGEAVPAEQLSAVTGAGGEAPPEEDSTSPAESLAEAEGAWGQEFREPELRNLAPESSGDSGRISLRAGESLVLPVEGGQEKTEKSGEDRRSGRKRAVVELRDYREQAPAQASSGPSPAGETKTEFHPELSRTALAADLSGPAERGARNSGGFEDILARELRQTINNDIVRHAQVILREGGEGLIRLSLKPESLGNVKIRLELTENKIAGRVIVESGEALRAFERELASLEQAFRDSGYESAELGAFLAQDGSGGGREQGEPSPHFAADRAASRYDDALEKTNPSVSEDFGMGFWPGTGPISINLLV